MSALLAMLLDPLGAGKVHLQVLLLVLGDDIAHWPRRAIHALQVAILIGVPVLWRKLFKFFDAYPWALAPAFDENRTDEERRGVLQTFFAAD